jgi:hypothetical protein
MHLTEKKNGERAEGGGAGIKAHISKNGARWRNVDEKIEMEGGTLALYKMPW